MERGLLQHVPPPPAGFSEMSECGSTQDFTGGNRCEGLAKPRALLLTEFPPGRIDGRMLDLRFYDCNMKLGPTRRRSSPHGPIMGPSGDSPESVLWLAQKPLQSRFHEQDCSAQKESLARYCR